MRYLGILTSFALCVAVAAGDDRAREEAAEAEELCADEVAHWKLTADETALDNPKEPVLRWTNPSVGRVYGNTYVWLQNGRPVAVGCIFRIFVPWNTLNCELAALDGTKLIARRDDKAIWRPKDEWKWQAVPGAPTPASTAPQRLAQMRAMAAEFTVEVLDARNNPKGDEQMPRLLPRPLYRYDAKQTKQFDGGLFAFVLGTDPELMVLLECDTAAEKPQWSFGVTRMNRDAIRLKHKGAKVWEVPTLRDDKPEDPYIFFGLGRPQRKAKP